MKTKGFTAGAIVTVGALLLAGCGSTKSEAIAVHLNGAGCDPGSLAIPASPVTLHVTNDTASGEFEIDNAAGNSVGKIDQINQGETKDLKVNLGTGYYTVNCGTDDTTAMLTAGTPTGAPVDLGSAPAADTAAPAGYGTADGNSYASTNLIASSAKYNPQVVDPGLVDAWGLAERPAGMGGDIWVASNHAGTSLEYRGDVNGKPLYMHDFRIISTPGAPDTDPGAPAGAWELGQPTGMVYNNNTNKYIVDQGAVKASAKFIFAGQDGSISAWTEAPATNGNPIQLAWSTKVVDDSAGQSSFFGINFTPDGSHLLVSDFGQNPGIKEFDSSFKPVATTGFANPFVKSTTIKPNDLLPWNIATVGNNVYISYAQVGTSESNANAPSVGEEVHQAGAGRVVEYDQNGNMVKILNDKGSLDAPWGMTIAPKGFGKLTGDLLVANFGDGTVSAFDANGNFVDYARGSNGKPLDMPGIWALMPGNGDTLGAANSVYFTAGPDAENAGIFGRIDAK